MKINVAEKGSGIFVLDLEGDLDMSASPQVRSTLLQILNKTPSHVIVDLSKVAYIDSSGIATFVEGLQLSRKAESRFTLAGANPAVASIFELAHLKEVFELIPDAGRVIGE